jgi:glutathione S-transferase
MPRRLYSLACAERTRHFSPHVWKIILALRHKGLDFELVPLSFGDIPRIEDGSFTSVPVLNDNGHLEGDSFRIAVYLDEAYPEAPSLFGGAGGIAMARFFEAYCHTVLHPPVSTAAVRNMHAMMSPADQAHFTAVRQKRFGKSIEEIYAGRDAAMADFEARLAPLNHVLGEQPWFGGASPLFCDHVVFGAFQWARVCLETPVLPQGSRVADWFERCLDLYDGAGRSAVPARPVAA